MFINKNLFIFHKAKKNKETKKSSADIDLVGKR